MKTLLVSAAAGAVHTAADDIYLLSDDMRVVNSGDPSLTAEN